MKEELPALVGALRVTLETVASTSRCRCLVGPDGSLKAINFLPGRLIDKATITERVVELDGHDVCAIVSTGGLSRGNNPNPHLFSRLGNFDFR